MARAILMKCFKDNGESYFPEKFPIKKLENLREKKGEATFAHQYLNVPLSEKEAKFKKENINYFKDLDSEIATARFMTIDLGGSQDDSTPTGIVIVDVDKNNNWYVQYAKELYVDPLDLIEEIFRLYNIWQPEMIGIEKEKYLTAIMPFLKQAQNKRNINLPLEELNLKVKGRLKKEDRILSLQPKVERGELHIKRNQKSLRNQLIRFPKGKNDVIDALSRINQIAHPPAKHIRKRRRDKRLDPTYKKSNKKGKINYRKYYDKKYNRI